MPTCVAANMIPLPHIPAPTRTLHLMRTLTLEEIRQCFSTSTDFNEIFDVFQSALGQKVADLDSYRLLFWNHSLTPDEVRLFGEKLAGEFPGLAYDVFLWLAGMFEATYSSSDNHELAVHYYRKAAGANPAATEPYLRVCDCYDPDLCIPPLGGLIEFVLTGLARVPDPSPLYMRLADLYEYAGDPGQSAFWRMKAEERRPPAPGGAAPAV
jgi:TPR repeat protein